MEKIKMIFTLTLFLLVNHSYAANPSTTSGIYFPTPIKTTPPAPPSTSGLMIPGALQPAVKSGTIVSPPATPVCVDSGVQGRRCGIEAVTFCRLNPDAQNCQTLNNTKSGTDK
jgi:hypothetical protein